MRFDSFEAIPKEAQHKETCSITAACFHIFVSTLIVCCARVQIVLLFYYYFSLSFSVASSMIQKFSFMKFTFCFSLMHSISFGEPIHLPVAEAVELCVFNSLSVFS